MLCAFCPPTISAISIGFCTNRPKSSVDKMYVAYEYKLWPPRKELSRKVSENRKSLGRNFSVICPGSCRLMEIQITSKEFFALPISVICTGVVPARKSFLRLHFLFSDSDFLIPEAGAKKRPKGGLRGPQGSSKNSRKAKERKVNKTRGDQLHTSDL